MFGFLRVLIIGAVLGIASTISAQAFTSKCTNPIECRCDRINPLKLAKSDWAFWYDNCVTNVSRSDHVKRDTPSEDPKSCGYGEKKHHKKYGKHGGHKKKYGKRGHKKYGKHDGHKKKYGKHGGHKKKYGKRGYHKKYGKHGKHKKYGKKRHGGWNDDNERGPGGMGGPGGYGGPGGPGGYGGPGGPGGPSDPT